MTRVSEMEQLIGEQATGPAERQALEAVTRRLQGVLEHEVPYRPQFKAQLRQQLMAAARQQMRPWYRRPVFWGSGMAVAAAAAALVVGLNLWQAEQMKPSAPPNSLVEVTPAPPETGGEPAVGPGLGPSFRVALPSDLPVVQIPDESLDSERLADLELPTGPQSVAGGLQLKQLTARPSEAEFRSMATQLAFRGESRRMAAGWAITEENRTLSMTADGEVEYADTSTPTTEAAEIVDAQDAGQVARRFLDRTLLPVVSQPLVTEGDNGYTVVYTEQVDGRPVVNAKTVIQVDQTGLVRRVKAYLASGVTTHTTYAEVLTEQEALAQANDPRHRFDRADLVWVRTPGDGTVYLQPYWRAVGIPDQGRVILRYIPALKR